MIDGRLLAPAAAAWLAAVATASLLVGSTTITARHHVAVVTLVATAVVAAGGLGAMVLLRRRRRTRARHVVAAVVALGAVVGIGSASAGILALSPAPLTDWVSARATASVVAVVAGEPRIRRSPNAPVWAAQGRQEVPLATSLVAARGERTAVDVPVLLRIATGVTIPPPGTEVLVVGRLSPPTALGDAATLTATEVGRPIIVLRGPGPIDRWAHAMRGGLRAALRGVPQDAASLVSGLAIGDDADQPDDLRRDMRTSGLSHLTAVSGGNVAAVLVVVLSIVGALRLSLIARVVAALASLVVFVVLVGPEPSVVRAAVMGGVVVAGMLSGGRRAGPAVLCTAVLVLVVLTPTLTASWGFGLSVAATGGLILVAPSIAAWLGSWRATRRWPPALRESLAITVAAQVATLPLLLAMGATVGLAALPANLLAMPVVGPITILGLLSALVSPVVPGLAAVLAHVAAPLAGWIAWVAHRCADLPLAVLPWPGGWWGAAALAPAAALVVGLGLLARRRWPAGTPPWARVAAAAVIVAITIMGTVLPALRRDWPPADWAMIMCDVGQGDALLLHSGPGQAVVVDTGPDPSRVDRCLRDAGVSGVPAVILTHFHADHVGGLAGVLEGRDVASVLATAVRDPPEEAAFVDMILADAGLEPIIVTAGDSRAVGRLRWRAIWPRRVIRSGSVPNNASIVLLATVGGVDLALMGDVEPEAQAALAADLSGRHVDVVKVPHHGSRYQDPRLPQWLTASVALISVGAGNDYGHPAASTIDAWRAAGALVARTDEVGDVAIVDRTDTGIAVVVRHGMLPSS